MLKKSRREKKIANREAEKLYKAWKQLSAALAVFDETLTNSRSPEGASYTLTFPHHGEGCGGSYTFTCMEDQFGYDLCFLWIPREDRR